MKRIYCLAFFALATAGALRNADAEHAGRPANLPSLGPNLLFLYMDENGAPIAAESGPGSTGATTVLNVFGWRFDNNDPNSPFEATSPAFTSTDPQLGYDTRTQVYAYNGSVLTLSNVNKHTLEDLNPNLKVGPSYLVLHETSQLAMTNSVIGNLQLFGQSTATLTDTKFTDRADEIQMKSSGTLTLTRVSTLEQVGSDGSLPTLIASNGTTLLNNSTLDQVTARDNASVTINESTIRSDVTTDTGGNPMVTVTGSKVGKLSSGSGSITISGGEIKGVVQAFGTGSVTGSGLTIPGSVTAVGNGLVNLSGSQVQGSLAAGSDLVPSKTSHIFMSGGTVQGHADVIGYGIIDLNGVTSLGAGSGVAASASGFATLNIFSTPTIKGGVTAEGNSNLVLSNVGTIQGPLSVSSAGNLDVGSLMSIAGDLTVSGKAKLSVQGPTITGGVVVMEEGSLELSGGNSQYAFVQDGTLKLNSVDVTGSIAAHGGSHLTFGGGSRTGGTIFNVGTQAGLVSVTGGLVTGNLAGFGSSITAMSGGHVRGFPVFQGGATFLYSGGIFDFFGIPQATAAVGGDEGPVVLEPLKGFAAIEDAEIQFIGHDLQSTLIDPNFIYGDSTYSVYQLTGRLADGTPIDGGLVYTQNGATARFQLIEAPVPEPSTLAIALLVVAAMGGRVQHCGWH